MGNLHDAKRASTKQVLVAAIKSGKEKLDTYFNKLLMEPDVSYYAVALFLHPKLRLMWFKTHWKHYSEWYKKAEADIRQIYKDYLDADIDDKLIIPPPSRRKLSPNYSSLYAQTMAVDPMLLTNTTSKRQKRGGQLEEYIGAQLTDLNNENEREQELLEDPWEW